MAENYKFKKEAREDLKNSIRFYESQEFGLGERFAKNVKHKLLDVCKKPNKYSTFYNDFRKAPIHKFPYNSIYRIQDKLVHIFAVWHTSRSQKKLTKGQLKNNLRICFPW
ncbi:MAG: type II toxin-antitoxin system RelE/ParE family toxin [Spirochaetota bacterium]